MITEEIGKRIKEIRSEKGISQEKLALKAELDRTYVAGVENEMCIRDRSSPSRPSVEDIRLAFDSKASYLILSLMADYPVLNSFHIEGGEWTKEDLRIYSEEYYF